MNKFEDLLVRFEGLLNRFEGEPGATSSTVTSGDAPATATGAKAPAKRLHKAVKEFDAALTEPIKKFVELSEKHSNKKINQASLYIKEMFGSIRNIIQAVTESKKAKLEDMAALISPIVKDLDNKIGKCSKDVKIKNHCRALLDSLQIIQLAILDDPHDMGKEFLAQIDFYGNKVLMERVELDSEWYTAFRKGICQTFFDYIVEAYNGGLPINTSGGDFKTNFEALQSGGEKAPVKEEKKTEVKEEKKAPAKPAAAKKPAGRPKPKPTKEKRGPVLDICFYENETIEIPEGELKTRESVVVTACKDTNFIIHGKFNNISLTNCKNCAVIIDSVISSVEIIKGEGVKLQVNDNAPQVIVDRSNKTVLYLNDKSKDLKVNTTCCTSTFIHFPTKEPDAQGNDEASLGIPETYVTTIKDDKLVTEVLDIAAE